MLTKGDDYPIHQTPDPIAYSGTDRNFYDRYFFNGYSRDGSIYFACALGVYPHLNIMDASFSVIVDGVQHAVHASRIMHMERLDLQVGPIAIEIVEPLEKLRIKIADGENDIHGDLMFTRRSAPLEEPRFQFRKGPRTLFDYTRLTQNGSWVGSLSVKGRAVDVAPEDYVGTRDRSWGVRPIGASDVQPLAPEGEPQFYWIWVPLNFGDRSSFYHINADGDGKPWNESGAVVKAVGEGGAPESQKMASCRSEITFKPGTRHASAVKIFMQDEEARETRIDISIERNFYMTGLGYMHGEWGHGHFKGELATGYESFDLASLDENHLHHLHVQALAVATMTLPSGEVLEGRGIVEQLILGPHGPSGFKDFMDLAP